MKAIKILAPISNIEDIEKALKTKCRSFYIYHSHFLKNGLESLPEFIKEAKKHNCKLYLNFKSTITQNDLEQVKKLLNALIKSDIDGIMVNSFSVLEMIKTKKMPFKVIIDSGLNIHNLSGIEFVNLFHTVENINITEEIYLKNIIKIEKYTKYKLSIDTDNLPWIAEEIKKSKAIDTIAIKGEFKNSEDLVEGIQLIEKILEKPKLFKNQKLPFKGLKDSFYESNHFSGELLSAEGKDFKFSSNIEKHEWSYKRTRLKKNIEIDKAQLPKINLRLTGFEHITALKKYIKKLGFNPVYSIEYGEILSTKDLYKNSFNQILEKIKDFCHTNNIKLQLSTPKVLIERDFDRVYDYVKQLFLAEPYPHSVIVNNIGYWWAIINDPEFERFHVELGQGLNLLSSVSMLCLANQHNISAIDLSTIKDIKSVERCIKKIKNKIPYRKLTVGGCVRVPSSGLCPLNNDSAILSRLSCTGPCRNGNYAIYDPTHKKRLPIAVDGFCRMHLYKENILDLFRHARYLQSIGVNEFVIDCGGLDSKLIPILLNRFLNAYYSQDYSSDSNFIHDEYKNLD